MIQLSIIIPVLNEAQNVVKRLQSLHRLLAKNSTITVEVIIVDGGSADQSWELLQKYCVQNQRVECLQAPAGRARQMNAGAAISTGEYLLFCMRILFYPKMLLRKLKLI